MAVWTFFTISGFFISQSFERHALTDFIVARILRIYPGLLVVLLISAFIIGPLFTHYSPSAYFGTLATYTYVIKSLSLVWMRFELPGIFSDNPLPGAINNPLWTLFYEVMCYAAVACVGLVSGRSKKLFGMFIAVYFSLYIYLYLHLGWFRHEAGEYHKHLRGLHEFSLPFVLGMIYYQFRNFIPRSIVPSGFALLGMYLLEGSEHFALLFVLLWSYIVIYTGFFTSKMLQYYNKMGDYSYGVYIYGWPVEQIIASHYHDLSPIGIIEIAIPVTLCIAICSWHCIEKPAMKLRPFIAGYIKKHGLKYRVSL